MKVRWWYWPAWSVGLKGLVVIALPFAVLLGSLGSSYRLSQQTTLAQEEVRRALQIQNDIQLMHSQIAEAATGVRGYLLTGQRDFLRPYVIARAQLPATLARLRTSVEDAQQKAALERIGPLVDQKMASLEELSTLSSIIIGHELLDHLRASKQVLDHLRAEILLMLEREAELIDQRTAAVNAAIGRSFRTTAIAAAVGLLGAFFALWLFFSSIVKRVHQIALNAERLVRGIPLIPVRHASDELGLLGQRLQNASAMLASRAAEAEAASRAKTEFLSRTSHELRTPLNAILGFAQLLESDLHDPLLHGHVTHISGAGQHLLKLIDEILEIARIEAGNLQVAAIPVCVADLLTETRVLISALAVQHKIVVQEPDCAPQLSVLGDRQRLLQVLLNLGLNAIKYNRPDGWVRLRAHASTPEGSVFIDVQDCGHGIAPALQEQLFMPFNRLGAEHGDIEGTGLGLAVSRQLVEAMQGKILVHSTPQGSTFSVRLPRAGLTGSMPPEQPGPMPMASVAAPDIRCKVLCIEDNVSNLALIEAILARRPGWQLISARNGAHGLDLARLHLPQLILLDLHLPDRGGEEVIAQLAREPHLSRIPVVILSADATRQARQRLAGTGIRDYLTKPLQVPQLLNLLDLLNRSPHE